MPTSRLISIFTRALASIFCIAIAVGIFSLLLQTKPQLDVVTGERSLPAVVVMEAMQIPIARRTVGYGTADALQHADVPALVASTVVIVPPTTRVGQVVKKGDLLVELDDVDYKQQVIRAELALKTAKSERAILEVERDAAEERAILAMKDQELSEAELQRVTDAFNRGAAKQREVDIAMQKTIATASTAVNATESANRFPSREEQASSTVSTKGAELILAEENLRRCKVISPIDGVIQEVDVRVGEHVNNGKRIARIVNSGIMEIPLRLPSYARSHVAVMDTVHLRSAGFGKRYWDAHVSRIAPEDDSKSRTMIIYIDVEQDPNSASRIPPGLFLRGVVINSKSATPRWVVPRRALRDDRVLVVRDSVLRSLPVVIDYSMTGAIDEFNLPDFDWAVLETPLSTGDLVVVDPGGSLRDGMRVRSILASEVALE
jgi:multidrug efflux pump subunit AcrA (membrane-fusion protein)